MLHSRSYLDSARGKKECFQDVGVPNFIHTDGAKELTEGKWKEVLEKHGGIKQTQTEPNSPFQNAAELSVREVKKGIVRKLHEKNASPRLWDSCGMLNLREK